MVTDPKDDDDKWMEYRHPRQRQLQREDAETLAMLKAMSPMVDDQRYAYEVRDALDTEGSRDGNGGVRVLADDHDLGGGDMSFTSGNWIAKPRAIGGYTICAQDDVLEDVIVAIVSLNDQTLEEARDNARLIAASKKMLEALRDARRELEEYELSATGENYNNTKLNAAIAEAEPQP